MEEEEEEARIDLLSKMTLCRPALGAGVRTCVATSCGSVYYNIPLVIPVNKPTLPTTRGAFTPIVPHIFVTERVHSLIVYRKVVFSVVSVCLFTVNGGSHVITARENDERSSCCFTM